MRRIRENIIVSIIVANAAIFVLTTLTGGPDPLDSALFEAMALHTPSVLHGQVWRLFTAQYLHWGMGHIFMNMLILYFLGRQMLADWGPRQFFGVYTAAGLVGNLFFVLLTTIGWLPRESIAAGASGCVLGILAAAAVRYPNAEILVMMTFPIRYRTLALIFGGWYLLNLLSRGHNAGGDACHLAGMLFGGFWAYRGEDWWRRRRGASFRVIGQDQRRAGPFKGRWRPWNAWRKDSSAPRVKPSNSTFNQRVQQRRDDEDVVDQILKKVYAGGIHSLTEAEKQILREATERQRAAEAGRVDQF